MSVVYAMYDALVSINVPDDKAKAVIDAMERDIHANRTDIEHLRELISRDIQAATRDVTIRLGTISGVWAGVLFALLKLTA
jgi:hypothetical protein